MPRSPRIVVPGYPHHVVHRGHNRQPIFETPGDYSSYLDSLSGLKGQYGVKVQAYCLMPNHVHLLLVPADAEAMGSLMKRLAGRHTARLNTRQDRTGALWEGRYYSSLVARDSYHQECHRYIELNPVRASLVSDPASYRWSSCRHRAGFETAAWLDFDPWFMALGRSPMERWRAYEAFLTEGVQEDRLKVIREAVRRGQLTGETDFAARVAGTIGRVVPQRGPGRPRKK
jgi:putative transposase